MERWSDLRSKLARAGSVRWAIVGAGAVCEKKSGPPLARTPGSEVRVVMRRDAEAARSFAERHGVARHTTSFEHVLESADVDAVYVATPPSSHEALAIAALRAGKVVYVEKPMALDHAACVRMLEASREVDRPLFVAYYRRRLPRFLRVRELLAAGAIGAVRHASIVLTRPMPSDPRALGWRVDPRVAGGGRFVDLGCHALDALDYLLGPIARAHGEAVCASGAHEAEDTVVASLRFESGVLGAGSWSFAADRFEDALTLVGSEGRITWSCLGTEPVRLERSSGVETFAEPTPEHVQGPLIASLVDELLGRAPPGSMPSTAESAARTSWVLDSILRGIGGGERHAGPGLGGPVSSSGETP